MCYIIMYIDLNIIGLKIYSLKVSIN